jgi:hypothetical protein
LLVAFVELWALRKQQDTKRRLARFREVSLQSWIEQVDSL